MPRLSLKLRNINKVHYTGIDVRVEPKFTIPDGDPYTGERWWSLPVLSTLLIRRLVSAPDRRARPEGDGSE